MKEGRNNFKVDFIGIGAPKCATTWIYQCLGNHPDICVSSEKETGFFLPGNKKGIEEFRNYFKNCTDGQIKGEFTPSYLYNGQETINKIKNHNPEVKLITSLRNPYERTASHFRHKRSRAALDSSSLSKALIEDRELIEHSKYYRYLSSWFEEFPSESVLIVLFDEIQKSPRKTIKKLYDFINVDKNFIPESINKKYSATQEGSVKSQIITWAFLKMRRIKEKVNSNSFLGKIYIPLWIKNGLRRLEEWNEITEVSENKSKKFVGSKAVKDRLKNAFRDDINNLEKLINKDLSHWK